MPSVSPDPTDGALCLDFAPAIDDMRASTDVLASGQSSVNYRFLRVGSPFRCFKPKASLFTRVVSMNPLSATGATPAAVGAYESA
jgi:hypothetical protein